MPIKNEYATYTKAKTDVFNIIIYYNIKLD